MKFQAWYAMEGDNSAREIEMAGGVKTNPPDVAPIEQHGAIDAFRVTDIDSRCIPEPPTPKVRRFAEARFNG